MMGSLVANCSKISYSSLAAAGLALRAIRQNSPRGKTLPEAIHPCSHCHAWHLTSDRRSRGNKWSKLAEKRFR
jgi:hypothetical protein